MYRVAGKVPKSEVPPYTLNPKPEAVAPCSCFHGDPSTGHQLGSSRRVG